MTNVTSTTARRGRARRPRPLPSYMEHHIDDLLEALEELLALPEIMCLEYERPFDGTLETIARARCVRSGVLDELAHLEGAP